MHKLILLHTQSMNNNKTDTLRNTISDAGATLKILRKVIPQMNDKEKIIFFSHFANSFLIIHTPYKIIK